MSSSNKTEKPTPEELVEESTAVFMVGKLIGLGTQSSATAREEFAEEMSKLNIKALTRFYNSPRSKPETSDFRYRDQVAIIIQAHATLFKS